MEVRRNEYDASIQSNYGLFGGAADWRSWYENISSVIGLFLPPQDTKVLKSKVKTEKLTLEILVLEILSFSNSF